jgi:hypothetical protein
MAYIHQHVSRVNVPSSYRERFSDHLGDAMGEVSYAGFSPSDVAAFIGLTQLQASALMNYMNGQPLSKAEAAQLAIDLPWYKSHTVKQGPYAGQSNWAYIQGQFTHMREHPKGSHHKGFTAWKDILLNMATYGGYGVGKAVAKTAKTGKIIPGLKDAMASVGTGGLIQPIIGTNKTLLLGGLITGGALAKIAAGAAGPLAGGLTKAGVQQATAAVTAPGPAPVPSGLDPRYNPGYASTPLDQQYNPAADAGFGPDISQSGPAEAGMFGGLLSSPLALGLLFGVPLVYQFFTKKK